MAKGRTNTAIEEVQTQLASAQGLHAALDVADLMNARYYLGQQWAVVNTNTLVPQTITTENLSVVANLIAPAVRQWHARLMVRDWRSKFEPADMELESQITARQMQAWWARFSPATNLTAWYGRLSLGRLILVGTFGSYYFDEKAPGGVRMCVAPRPTLDPNNPDPDLDEHEWVILSYAVSVQRAKALFGDVLEKQGVSLESDAKLADLRATESYLGRTIFRLQPGATMSETRGLVLHVRFREHWSRREVFLQNPSPTKQRDSSRPQQEWHAVADEAWDYGNPLLPLRCFDHPACAYSRSLVGECVPQQDLVSLAHKADFQATVARALYRIIIQDGSVVNAKEFKSNKPGAVLRLRPGTQLAPQVLQTPRIDSGLENLIARSVEWLKQTTSIEAPMRGAATGRVEAASAYQTLIEQGSAPIQSLADSDYDTTSLFFNRMGRAVVLKYGRTNPKRFIGLVGRTRANLDTVRLAADTLKKHPTKCVLRRGAFLARTQQEIQADLDLKLRAGHITKWEYDWELFLQTGYEGSAGQEGRLHNAQEIVRRLRDGLMQPQEIRQSDNHRLLKLVIDEELNQRAIMDYDEEQVARLEEAGLWCELWQMDKARREGSIAALTSMTGGVSPGSPAGAPQPSATAGEPTVGEAVGAAG